MNQEKIFHSNLVFIFPILDPGKNLDLFITPQKKDILDVLLKGWNMDLDDEELKATRNKFYPKEKIEKLKDIEIVVKRLINSEEKKDENS